MITASEVLKWTAATDQGGSFVAQLEDSLFDTLDGTPTGKLYNPFLDPIQPGSGCHAITTGQVYVDGKKNVALGTAFMRVVKRAPEDSAHKVNNKGAVGTPI